ncbi:hypothetical protein QT971_05795 [Microcoleus sp. herbarium19]
MPCPPFDGGRETALPCPLYDSGAAGIEIGYGFSIGHSSEQK